MENNLKKELEKAAAVKNEAERGVSIAAVIAEALRQIDQDPVLVGGSAVAFYTEGGYSTADIDMIAEGGPDLVRVMLELGFEKLGKDFVEKKLKIYAEFPGRSLGPSEKTDEIRVGKRLLKIISLEDLIVDRLCAFKFWKSAIDGVNAMLLLEQGDLEMNRLIQRAEEEDVVDALRAVEKISREVIRKRLPKDEANRLLEETVLNFRRKGVW